ncbi:glycosyltransferase [Dehalococcoidia bacterium]|nr:glycosyltransferase [Dehalococcoidia bacterium]
MTMTEAQQTRPKVLAAIPCFNTEPFIADVVSNAKKYVDQVIVIDDGSHDDTAEAARTAGALVISHEVNRGAGAATKSCFEAAKTNAADVLVILDGDAQHNPDVGEGR